MELVAAMGTKLKPDFGAQRTTPKNNFFASLCYFAQLLNSHFVWPAIDFSLLSTIVFYLPSMRELAT